MAVRVCFVDTQQDKQMTDTATALTELGVKEWVLRGEPTNQVEFEDMFRLSLIHI